MNGNLQICNSRHNYAVLSDSKSDPDHNLGNYHHPESSKNIFMYFPNSE